MKGKGHYMINQYLLSHKVEVTDGERIWYVAELSGFIMEVNLFSKELKCIWNIPNSRGECSYRTLFYCDHKLYVFPHFQETMYVYDLYTADFEKIAVKKSLELMGCVKRGQFLYAFGSKSEILKYNLKDGTVAYIDVQSELSDLENFTLYWFWTRAIVLDECICIPVSNSNIIVTLDPNDKISCMYLGDKPEKWILENIQASNGRYHVICCKGNRNDVGTSYIAEYDLNGRLILESSVEEKYSYQIYPFVNAVWIGDKWICLPYGRKEMILRDKEHDEILFEIDNGMELLNNIIEGQFTCSVWVNDHTVCSINQATESLIYIDLNALAVNYTDLEANEELQRLHLAAYRDAIKFDKIIKETNQLYNLKNYIDYIGSD